MMPSPFRVLCHQPLANTCADSEEFAEKYPAPREQSSRLWNLVENTRAVLLWVSPGVYRHCCREPASGPRGLVVSLEADRERRDRHGFRVQGACAREVSALLKRRDRARERLAEVEAGDRDEDAEELQRVIDVLDRRARARDDLETSFEYVWLRSTNIEAAYCHYEHSGPIRRQTKLGV